MQELNSASLPTAFALFRRGKPRRLRLASSQSEQPISGISQSGHDESFAIEPLVDGSGENGEVG